MSRVRGHTRNVDGRDVRVRSHSRRLQPGRGMNNLGRAYQSARRQKRSAALTFAGLGIAEIGAWFTLKGVGLVLMTVGVIALGIGYAATRPTSTRRTIDPWQVTAPKQRRQPQPVDPEAQSVEAAADMPPKTPRLVGSARATTATSTTTTAGATANARHTSRRTAATFPRRGGASSRLRHGGLRSIYVDAEPETAHRVPRRPPRDRQEQRSVATRDRPALRGVQRGRVPLDARHRRTHGRQRRQARARPRTWAALARRASRLRRRTGGDDPGRGACSGDRRGRAPDRP